MKLYFTYIALLLLSLSPFSQLLAQPNIVWVVSEDNSIHYMNLYTEGGARMPNIEALAKKGITYKHAFSQAPVCSVARSTLISGCYAPRIGVQYHRRTQKAPMPEGVEMFPAYLRKIGYYTSNNSKEDYNIIKPENVWDESSRQASYRNRKPGQPFFHVQNFGTTHEGKLHFTQEQMEQNPTETDPDDMIPFPYHPNTSTSRYTYAKYHDLHQTVDKQIGAFIKQLEADGLMENTFIFYYGDHGGVLPRSKGYVYESGLHVPLVVYVPEKYKDLVPSEIGGKEEAFVRFIDFGPTVLNLAGAKVPEGMDGKPFLGKGVSQQELSTRNSIWGYADRFDEKYDLVRSYRKGKYKYIRNYQPFNFDGLHNFYRYKMLLYQEWKELYQQGKLNPVQQQFFKPRPPEQLFEVEKDPHEVNDLADDEAFKEVLVEMRKSFNDLSEEIKDLSFIHEPYFIEKGIDNPVKFGQENQELITSLREIADAQLLPYVEAKSIILGALRATHPLKRYWGLITCSSFGKQAIDQVKIARKLAKKDADNLVRVRAAEFLALVDDREPQKVILKALSQAKSRTEANLMLNTLVLLRDTKGYEFSVNKEMFDPRWLEDGPALVMRRLEYVTEE